MPRVCTSILLFVLTVTPSFAIAQSNSTPSAQQEPREPAERIETWGEFDPGRGFLVGRSDAGELSISILDSGETEY